MCLANLHSKIVFAHLANLTQNLNLEILNVDFHKCMACPKIVFWSHSLHYTKQINVRELHFFFLFFSLNLQRTFAIYSVVTRKLNDVSGVDFAAVPTYHKGFQRKFLLSLIRPTNVFLPDPETNTKPFSDTTALRNPIKPSPNFLSRRGGELVKIMNKQSGLAEREAHAHALLFPLLP